MADDEKPTGTGRGRLALIAVGAFILGALTVLLFALLRRDEGAEAAPSARAAAANQAAPVQAEADVRTRPRSEQLAAAFEAAFGGRSPATRRVGGETIAYRPAGLRWVGDRAVLVSTGNNAQDCHACAGWIAIHYLAPQGGGLRVTGEWLEGGGGGSWAARPNGAFRATSTGN